MLVGTTDKQRRQRCHDNRISLQVFPFFGCCWKFCLYQFMEPFDFKSRATPFFAFLAKHLNIDALHFDMVFLGVQSTVKRKSGHESLSHYENGTVILSLTKLVLTHVHTSHAQSVISHSWHNSIFSLTFCTRKQTSRKSRKAKPDTRAGASKPRGEWRKLRHGYFRGGRKNYVTFYTVLWIP